MPDRASISEFVVFTELDDVTPPVIDLFQRKFGHAPPTFPHHFVALYRGANAHPEKTVVLGYTHLLPYKGALLSGGSCTSGAGLRQMTASEQAAVARNGGIWRDLFLYAATKYADQCDAFFGYCGDARALQVCLELGFERLPDPYLIVRWHKPLSDRRREELLSDVRALGAF